MPELKRNFLKGKMNKDLDERLVPNGEYRDALNIEVSSADGSNVGSVENLKGNKYIENVSFTLSSSAESVGHYVDESNSHAYNFIRLASDLTQDTDFADYSSTPRYLGVKSDVITRFTDIQASNQNKTEVVFCDVYEVRVVPNAFTGNVINGLDTNIPLYIRPGMRVQAIDLAGNDLWGESNDVRVVSAPWPSLIGASTGTVNITSVLNISDIYTSDMIDAGVVIRFTNEKILNFRAGTLELEQNNKNSSGVDVNSSAVYTPKNNIITGINIIDDLLYFTDNYDEPKKINITQCIKGSGYSNATALKHHTRLIIQKDGSNINKGHIKKSNITLIKPSPTRAPRVKGFNSARDGVTSAYLYDSAGTEFDLSPNGVLLNATGYSTTSDTIQLNTGNVVTSWIVGDIIRMTGITSEINVDLVVDQVINPTTFVFQVRTIPSSYTVATAPELWIAKLFEKENIYEDKFISFAYRYKYNDNEYSVISPYSKPLFIPGKYNYDPISGFNDGMTNHILQFF